MRRIVPPNTERTGVPTGIDSESYERSFIGSDLASKHKCWGCPDTPCMTLPGGDNQTLRAVVELPQDPSLEVCPVGALSRTSPESVPQVDDSCLGCGLCVRACPVGAITIDPVSSKAVVEPYESLVEVMTFRELRAARESGLSWDMSKVDVAIPILKAAVEHGLESRSGDLFARRFLRSALAIEGVEVQLSNLGDNGAWPEATALVEESLVLCEITSGVDLLDPLRRLLLAFAHVRQRLERDRLGDIDVSISVVSGGLVNRRSDSYRLIQDIDKYLGIRTRVVPIAAIALLLTLPGKVPSLFNYQSDPGGEAGEQLTDALVAAGLSSQTAIQFRPAK